MNVKCCNSFCVFVGVHESFSTQLLIEFTWPYEKFTTGFVVNSSYPLTLLLVFFLFFLAAFRYP